MRTLRTELRWATVALTVILCTTSGQLRAEERDSSLRRQLMQLNDVTGKSPLAGGVLALMSDKASARKMVDEAARMAKEKPQPFTYNATLILATLATDLKSYDTAETFYRLHMDQAKQLRSLRGLISAYGGLITVLYANKKYAEAEKACSEIIDHELLHATLQELARDNDKEAKAELKSIERFLSAVIEEMILTIARQGDTERAVGVVDRVLKNQSSSWLALDLKARIYQVADKNEQAVKIYEDELERLKDDKDLDEAKKETLIDDIRYKLSGLYVDINQVDKAAEQLKSLLKKSPKNPTYNNDLGYIWADHDMNLAESEKLVRKAIEEERKLRRKANITGDEDKDNAAYLDSLGWVLFKQKKYQEAKKYLQQAVEQEEGNHIEILDHLGEVLLALGQKSEAVGVWKKGVAAAGDSKREQKRKAEVEKKIKANE
jgi:tetratricopeptide (TPR) repeat protein